jgi:hypothetical protein
VRENSNVKTHGELLEIKQIGIFFKCSERRYIKLAELKRVLKRIGAEYF